MSQEIVIAPLPYGEIIDPRGEIRMSSNTALATDATIHLHHKILRQNPAAQVKIFIAGEDTFGPDFPSSADKMRAQMIKKGIPKDSIETIRNTNNTEEQVAAISKRTQNPLIVALNFHAHRTGLHMMEQRLWGNPISAEKLVLEAHPGATKARLRKFAMTKVRVKVGKFDLPISKIRAAELISTVGVYFGKPGKAVVSELKKRQGSGSAIADYHHVETGSVHMANAMRIDPEITDPKTIEKLQLRRERVLALLGQRA